MAKAPTDVEIACFEAGIKFGSLYHQFAGTPVSPRSVSSLERAIEESIENQPYCKSVTVDIDSDRVLKAIDHDQGYTELTGAFMVATIVVEYETVTATGTMTMRDGYPTMRIVSVETTGSE